MTDSLAAPDRLALNRAVHGEVMGKRVLSEEEMREAWRLLPGRPRRAVGHYWLRIGGYAEVHPEGLVTFRQDIPDYSGSWSAVREVEDEIARRGLGEEYMKALGDVLGRAQVDPVDMDVNLVMVGWDEIWNLYRATAEQRMQAALSVVRAHSPSGAGHE